MVVILFFQTDAEDVCTILKQALQIVYSRPPSQSSEAPAAAVQRRQSNRKKGADLYIAICAFHLATYMVS